MKFVKPEVEFIDVAASNVVVASGCTNPGVNKDSGSYEYCDGPQAPMNNCSKYNTFLNG